MDCAALAPLVGEWSVELGFPDDPPGRVTGHTEITWLHGQRFVLQRTRVDLREAPDSTAIVHPDGDAFVQHYFDERGTVRLYAMSFAGGRWTLERSSADFSPLPFAQRFDAEVTADAVHGAWMRDGAHDFDVTYTRIR